MLIDDKTLNALATKAILDQLTPEARQELLTNAVASFFSEEEKPDAYSYGKPKKTKIQAAFDRALTSVIDRVLMDLMREPENMARIRAAGANALEKFLTETSGALEGKLYDALAKAFNA